MMFSIFVLCFASIVSIGSGDDVLQSNTIITLSDNSTSPGPGPLPPPHPKPKPHPKPPAVTDASVYESKVYGQSVSEYQRFGHSISAFSSSVAVGSSKESIAPSVYLYSVQVSSSEASVSQKSKSFGSKGETQYSHSKYVNVTWSEEEEYFAPDASEATYYDGYGQVVAMSELGLVVGAPYSNVEVSETSSAAAYDGYSVGAAHFFSSATEEVQTLTPSTQYANMQFASALSLQNATLAVGAPGASEAGQMSGAVYVFQYNSDDGEWVEEAELIDDEEGAAFAKFGCSVSLSSDASLLAVGASGYSRHVIHGGAVFLYQREAQQSQHSGNASANTMSNAFTNGTGNSTGNSTDPGEPPEETTYAWVLHSLLVPSSLSAYAYFGHTVAFRDNIGLVSAFDESGSGVVYLYEQQTVIGQESAGFLRGFEAAKFYTTTTLWVLTSMLTPSSPSPVNRFGASLAIFHTSDAYSRYTDESGTVELEEAYVLAIGAPGDSAGSSSSTSSSTSSRSSSAAEGVDYAGAVYLYLGPHGSDSSARRRLTAALQSSSAACCPPLQSSTNTAESDEYTLMSKVLANDSTAYNNYGSSLALMGAHLLVGAELADTDFASRAGAVYVETNLIPYLVAVTQQAEAEEDDDSNSNDGGGAGPDGSSARTGWAAFLAFFGTSGGIVTMSFLPIAVLAVLFVAHSRTKGKMLAFDFAKPSCCASANGGTGEDASGGALLMAAPVAQQINGTETAAASATIRKSAKVSPVPDAGAQAKGAALHRKQPSVQNPLQQSQLQEQHQPQQLTAVDLEQQQQQLPQGQAAEESAAGTDTTPSFWQRLLHFLRNPSLLRHAAVHARLPATDATTSATASVRNSNTNEAQPVAPPNSPADGPSASPVFAPPAGNDLRLRSATVADLDPPQELSIRSPITHIPQHISLVQSPHGNSNNTGVSVRSYRFSASSAPTTTAAGNGRGGIADLAKENRAPAVPSQDLDAAASPAREGELNGLLSPQKEAHRQKEKATKKEVAAGPSQSTPLLAADAALAVTTTAGASSAPKPHSTSTVTGAGDNKTKSKSGSGTIRV